jgi:carotenoid cleavage dioxygenase
LRPAGIFLNAARSSGVTASIAAGVHMTVSFKDQPTAVGFYAPTRFEVDVFDCEIEGKIPSDLNGAFYRVGPDFLYPSKYPNDAGAFNGDGHVGMFRIANGSCDYKSRYVRTPRYLADRKARRQMFGNYRNRGTDDPSVRALSGTVANTAMFHHAGKLFALKEDSVPYEMDPDTLETKGPWDFHGKYQSRTFTAHPKHDPVTGDMIAFGYEATGPVSRDVFVTVVDKKGRVKQQTRFEVPVVSMMHDMALTDRHMIFNTTGYVSSQAWLDSGKVHWGWDSTVPTYVGILPRDADGRDIRWFKGPARGAIHLLNAATRGNKVILETPVSDGNPFPQFPQVDGSPWNPAKGRTLLRRWTLDLASGRDTWDEEILFPQIAGALPRIDDRYIALPYRYAFNGYSDPSRPFDEKRAGNLRGRVTNCYARMDLQTGKVDSYFAGDVHSLQEVQFVPRKKGAAEGDGYLIGVAANHAEMHSELVIADATRLGEGDVARVKLPFRAHQQVHGWWVPADELPLRTPV